MCICTPSVAVFRTCYNQIDWNLANFEATIKVGQFLECLSLTTQWYHVRAKHIRFHKAVWRQYSGEVIIIRENVSSYYISASLIYAQAVLTNYLFLNSVNGVSDLFAVGISSDGKIQMFIDVLDRLQATSHTSHAAAAAPVGQHPGIRASITTKQTPLRKAVCSVFKIIEQLA